MKTFRAWHKEQKRMFSISLIDLHSQRIYEYINDGEGICGRNEYHFSEVEIMEGTNVLDCDEKEIFEGDVLKITDTDDNIISIQQVYNQNNVISVDISDFNPEIDICAIGWLHDTLELSSNSFKIEIIGNVHQNKELLNEK